MDYGMRGDEMAIGGVGILKNWALMYVQDLAVEYRAL
jgi:hypothetical protein